MSRKIPKWLLDDNTNRAKAYSRNLSDEEFLRDLNDLMVKQNFQPEIETDPKPMIFFFGVPRCGKTFFSQMIVHLLDLGYPDNVIARFWRSPSVGIRLTQILRKASEERTTFHSDYGKTKGVFDPHDFAYFWHEHLLKKSHPYDFEAAKSAIDWKRLGNTLNDFTSAFGKACIMKGVNPSYHINEIAKAYPKSLFIYIQRDFIDSAVSLYRGRLKNYNDENRWYGQTPSPEHFNELSKLPFQDQIAGQFDHLTNLYERQLSALPEEQQLRIRYDEFCFDPMKHVDLIRQKVKELTGFEINSKGTFDPASVSFSKHSKQTPELEKLKEGLDRLNLPHRMT